MTMEIVEPTGALDMVVERFLRPRFRLLCEIIRGVVGGDLPQERVELSAQSIIGQCVHLVHARPITTRLLPHLSYTPDDLDRLAAHVTEFSLHALERLGELNGNGKGNGDAG